MKGRAFVSRPPHLPFYSPNVLEGVFSEVRIAPALSPKITAGFTLLFWRIIPDDMGILLLRDLALSGRPQALFTWRLAAKASGGPTDTALLPTQGCLVPPAPRRHKKA